MQREREKEKEERRERKGKGKGRKEGKGKVKQVFFPLKDPLKNNSLSLYSEWLVVKSFFFLLEAKSRVFL